MHIHEEQSHMSTWDLFHRTTGTEEFGRQALTSLAMTRVQNNVSLVSRDPQLGKIWVDFYRENKVLFCILDAKPKIYPNWVPCQSLSLCLEA